jgi:hypothetical protein
MGAEYNRRNSLGRRRAPGLAATPGGTAGTGPDPESTRANSGERDPRFERPHRCDPSDCPDLDQRAPHSDAICVTCPMTAAGGIPSAVSALHASCTFRLLESQTCRFAGMAWGLLHSSAERGAERQIPSRPGWLPLPPHLRVRGVSPGVSSCQKKRVAGSSPATRFAFQTRATSAEQSCARPSGTARVRTPDVCAVRGADPRRMRGRTRSL